MNLVKKIIQFNIECVFFSEPIKNNVLIESKFIRIIYSSSLFTLTGIYLYLTFNNLIVEKYYNKYKCVFDSYTNRELINNIKTIEINILLKLNIINKIPKYQIFDQMNIGNIKIFTDHVDYNKKTFILKISGIWENEINYGLTYKFIAINKDEVIHQL